jgi:uncharacterized protein (TIGR00369 family)
MELTWPDRKDATEALRAGSPVHDRMGLTVSHQEPGVCVLTMELLPEFQGIAAGSIHGGVLATLADAACAMCLDGTYEVYEEVPVTTDMHVRYYRQPQAGPLSAAARMVHRGRRLLSSECTVTDAEDRVLIRSTATYMLVPLQAPREGSTRPISNRSPESTGDDREHG